MFEPLDNFRTIPLLGVSKRSQAIVVFCGGVGVLLQHELDCIHASRGGGIHQRCLALIVLRIDVCAPGKQEIDDRCIPPETGVHQRRCATIVGRVSDGAFLYQQLRNLRMARSAGSDERGLGYHAPSWWW